ncbi:kinesin-like protein KIF18A isoform X2 [Narcine bancroftii]|uniref:kinesin-like protein KIF18A isoform X2 n=1 Tax=Narcine bancroftii TaxID=1343680 RepID=UPI00383221A9
MWLSGDLRRTQVNGIHLKHLLMWIFVCTMSPTEYVRNRVKVFIRLRPENSREKIEKHHKVVHVVDKHMLVFDPKEEEIGFLCHPKVQRYNLHNKNKDLQFVFDHVFDDNASQLDVFEETKSILESAFNGYNCTVFAYGATGSGKTHTMLGSSNKPGVMYLIMKELYNRIEQLKNEKSCDVAVSYLEVYNEEVRDLLTNSRSLAVREDAQNGVVIQGLTLHKPTSLKQLLQMLDFGNKNRTQHPTDTNSSSSRSHAVFQIYLRQQDRTANINQNIKIAKMCLVDLAGSERMSAMNMKAARFREGTNINRSLLALGNVINALTDSKKKAQYIPYRNSKLTRLLKDSLGGNCQTIMIAAIGPSSLSYEDTYNTLKYANRAKDIKSSIKSNVLNLNCHVGKYAQICEAQRQEIMELKEKLKTYECKELVIHNNHRENILLNPKESEIKRFKEVLENTFCNRQKIRINCLDLELKMKEIELKIFCCKQHHKRTQLFSCKPATDKASSEYEAKLAVLKIQYNCIQQKIKAMLKMLEENNNQLHHVENEMCFLGQDGMMPQVLKQELQCCHLKMEVMDLKRQIQSMDRLCCLQKPVNRRAEKLVNTLLPALHQQYQTLKEAGLASATAKGRFAEVEQLLKDENVNIWEDQITELPEQISDQLNIDIKKFSQLCYSQDTPCSSKRMSNLHTKNIEVKDRSPDQLKLSIGSKRMSNLHTKNIEVKDRSPDQLKLSIEPKENIPLTKKGSKVFSRKSSRRRLEQSLTCSISSSHATSNPHLTQQNDLSKEGLAPLPNTPDSCRSHIEQVPCQPPITDLKSHKDCHVEKMENNLTDMEDAVFGISENPTSGTCDLRGSSHTRLDTRIQCSFANYTNCKHTVTDNKVSDKQPTHHKSFLQRLGLPSLLSTNETNSKPSYMSLTSAARRKRKSGGFMGQRDGDMGPSVTKRILQDVLPAAGNKPTWSLWTGQSQTYKEVAKRKPIFEGDLIGKGLSNNIAKRRHLKSMQ